MWSRSRFCWSLVLGLFVFLLAGSVWLRGSGQTAKTPSSQSNQTAALGGPDRYLTFLSTDKPIYRPGEKVYIRGVLLHHLRRTPLANNAQANAAVEIKGPKGDTVGAGHVTSQDSVLGFTWSIPETQSGGEYVVHVRYPWSGYAPASRKFDIRVYRAPRLKSQIKFLRDGYGPGDSVTAMLHVERAEGGFPSGAAVTAIARVDGQEAFRGPAIIDSKGDCTVHFPLPADIRRGEGSLAMVIADGGVVETAGKTIPILLQTVDLTMYPEGGELVAGLPNRVYFEAFTPAKKPADLAGVVVDEKGAAVAEFRSEHEGRGRFRFTPRRGGTYSLKITEPAGIRTTYPLAKIQSDGAALTASKDVTGPGEKVSVQVGVAKAGEYVATLRQREREIARKPLKFSAAQMQTVQFDAQQAEGVLQVTVWSKQGKPLAERLVYRQPSKSIQVKVTADEKQYTPGGKAKLTIETHDENGRPVSAVVGVTVTDDSIRQMQEKREQSPSLPVMVLLEADVKDLADAHVYLDPQNDQAPLSVDLLLGVQGWRRFAFYRPQDFLAKHGDSARRVLALRMASRRDIRRGRRFLRLDENFDANAPLPLGAAGLAGAKVDDASEPAEAPKKKPAEVPVANKDAEKAFNGKAQASEPAPAADSAPQRQRKQLAKALAQAEKKLAGEALFQNQAAGQSMIAARNDFVAVRVYAHQLRPGRRPGHRTDFSETLFWSAGLKTDQQGKAQLEFALNDSVTSFHIAADVFDGRGGLGGGSLQIESVEPFYVEPKLPLAVTMGDVIRAPIGIVNATQTPLPNAFVEVDAQGTQRIRLKLRPFTLGPNERARKLMTVNVSKFNGQAKFTLKAGAGPYADQVTRSMRVTPLGFPIEVGQGGLLGPGETVTHEITIAEQLVPGSLQGDIKIYPTPLASMTEALERLIREPSGCFEQTSSTTYPLVMAQQYFMSHQGVDPALIERSSQLLEKGYQRLIGFECKNGGFEWFGSDPGHDALTAYGLLEFTDMAKVRQVDPAMLQRTRKWLLEQRDGKGGYQRKTHTLHTWLPDPEIANTYNTWALLEAGIDADLSKEIAWIGEAARKTENTYVMALAANVAALGRDKDLENQLLDKLAGKQTDQGSLEGATRSVVGSTGQSLSIETTALAVMAWLKNSSYAPQVEKGIKHLAESCKAGRFGSTQSTVLALRAIVAYDQSRARPKSPGSLQLLVDGQKIGAPVKFTAEDQGAIRMPSIAAKLTPGKHKVQIQMTGGSQMPYSIAAQYHSLQPASSDQCALHFEARLKENTIQEGAMTEADVVVVNRTGETVPNAVAIVGVPGGLEPDHDHLKELVSQGKIAAYEVIGRDVVFYWRSLQKEERVELSFRLTAAVPGVYTGPASRAYLYYTDEHKQWTPGFRVEITPKG